MALFGGIIYTWREYLKEVIKMLVSCTALIDNEAQIENLCQCIEILGGKPEVDGCSVGVAYEGNQVTAEKFIELFEHYPFHNITVIE